MGDAGAATAAVHFKLFPYEPALPRYYKQKPQEAGYSADIDSGRASFLKKICLQGRGAF